MPALKSSEVCHLVSQDSLNSGMMAAINEGRARFLWSPQMPRMQKTRAGDAETLCTPAARLVEKKRVSLDWSVRYCPQVERPNF